MDACCSWPSSCGVIANMLFQLGIPYDYEPSRRCPSRRRSPMPESTPSIADEIERYVRTGDADMDAWV